MAGTAARANIERAEDGTGFATPCSTCGHSPTMYRVRVDRGAGEAECHYCELHLREVRDCGSS